MAAYVIVDVDLQNPEALEQYRQRVIPIVQSFGGRYLVAGPDGDALEGTWRPRTMAIIEFPSMEQAQAWWSSDAYHEVKPLRHRAGPSNVVMVQGL